MFENQTLPLMIKRTLLFQNPAYLSTKNNQLLVKLTSDEVKTVPIEDIGMMVLENQQITLTNGLIEKLTYQNVAIVCCNQQHLPLSLLSPLSGHSEFNERLRFQLEASLPLKKYLWQQTIISKITNQANLLGKLDKPNAKLRKWSNEVLSGDTSNKESHSAAYYWEHLFADISGFYRGQKEIPPNNLLNYGYAILRAVCARSLIGSGLLPVLGIHHANKYNAYCLADDIMEPYRPFVDEIVYALVEQTEDFSELTQDLKQQLLLIPAIDVTIDGRKSPLMVAMSRTTNSLYECFAGVSRKIIYPAL